MFICPSLWCKILKTSNSLFSLSLISVVSCEFLSCFSLVLINSSWEVIKWVSQPTHTHRSTWRRLKWPSTITRLTAHFIYGLVYDLLICKLKEEDVMHDAECTYRNHVSWTNTNLKPNWCEYWCRMSLLRPGVVNNIKTKKSTSTFSLLFLPSFSFISTLYLSNPTDASTDAECPYWDQEL